MTVGRGRTRGFALIEVVVALAILAFSLVALYRAAGSSVRAMGDASRFTKAMVLAESVMQSRQGVPPEGWAESGDSIGLRWSVNSAILVPAKDQAVALHRVQVDVLWDESGRERRFSLASVLPELTPTNRVVP